jgi:hypothetical protein
MKIVYLVLLEKRNSQGRSQGGCPGTPVGEKMPGGE